MRGFDTSAQRLSQDKKQPRRVTNPERTELPWYRASAPNNNNTRKAIHFSMLRRVIAARYGSQGLAYLSTAYYVSRLNFWVRNGSRCVPTAMAAITQSQGPDLNRSVVDLQSTA